MSNSREEFKKTLALGLETIFEDLKQNSKALVENCVLPMEGIEIKIDPMFNDTCPSIQVTYDFLLNKESMEKILDNRRKYISNVDNDEIIELLKEKK